MDIQGNFAERGKAIAEKLIARIEKDRKIVSSDYLGFSAIEDSLPAICQILLEAIACEDLNLVTNYQKKIGIQHGFTRSEQEFDPEEIVREFYLLKQTILAEFRPQLLNQASEKMLQKLATIDRAIELLMENSFQSYIKLRRYQLKKLRQEIFLTNQELSRLLKDRQNNMTYLTHEIKNSLTSIIGYSDLFLRQQQLDRAEKNGGNVNLSHIEQILQQGRNVLRLVNDTIEMDSSGQGNLKLQIQQVNLCSLIEDIVFGLKPSIDDKQIDLIVECFPKPLVVETDCLRLQQIITNLLINAIRYTPSGKISLVCQIVDSSILEIRVNDTGVGISEAEQKHIFEPYFRSERSQKKVPEGIGLGLAIVARLVTLLNGKISLVSEVNVGSTFIITIPLHHSVNFPTCRNLK